MLNTFLFIPCPYFPFSLNMFVIFSVLCHVIHWNGFEEEEPMVLSDDAMLLVQVPQGVSGIAFILEERDVAQRSTEWRMNDDEQWRAVTLSEKYYSMYTFKCADGPVSLSHMSCIVHHLNQVTRVHVILPSLIKWFDHAKTCGNNLFLKGRLVCHVWFKVQDGGRRVKVWFQCVPALQKFVKTRLLQVIRGQLWLPALVDFGSKYICVCPIIVCVLLPLLL